MSSIFDYDALGDRAEIFGGARGGGGGRGGGGSRGGSASRSISRSIRSGTGTTSSALSRTTGSSMSATSLADRIASSVAGGGDLASASLGGQAQAMSADSGGSTLVQRLLGGGGSSLLGTHSTGGDAMSDIEGIATTATTSSSRPGLTASSIRDFDLQDPGRFARIQDGSDAVPETIDEGGGSARPRHGLAPRLPPRRLPPPGPRPGGVAYYPYPWYVEEEKEVPVAVLDVDAIGEQVATEMSGESFGLDDDDVFGLDWGKVAKGVLFPGYSSYKYLKNRREERNEDEDDDDRRRRHPSLTALRRKALIAAQNQPGYPEPQYAEPYYPPAYPQQYAPQYPAVRPPMAPDRRDYPSDFRPRPGTRAEMEKRQRYMRERRDQYGLEAQQEMIGIKPSVSFGDAFVIGSGLAVGLMAVGAVFGLFSRAIK